MNDQHVCQRCGRELAEDAPEGICPSCLMEANLGTGPGTLATVGGGRREPLPVAEVARLFPEMEAIGLIGTGGMGAVYKARQPKLDRFVALKILHADERDPSFIDRFTREARTLARLSHPNIVAVYDFGQRSRRREEADGAEEGDVAEGPPPHVGGYGDEGGDLFFLIMELVDGVTLRRLLQEGKMQPEQALAIVPPICEALQYAHEKGVVHRDIKPENILLDKDGRVKVADFGIARLAGLDRAENLTGEGQVIGTAHYMAPEQVERPASVDHRADIYALGVVFYEMLTGELPLGRFPHPSKKVQIDVRLDEVVLKALEKEPEQRYQQASEMRTGVETVRSTASGPQAQGVSSADGWAESSARRSLLWYGFGVSLIGLPVGLAMGLPLVWGLSLMGIVVGAWKLKLIGGEKPVSGGSDQGGGGWGASRFSRTAIVGAVWSVFVLVAAFGLFSVRVPAGAPPPFPVWRWFLLPLSVVGLAAPFGTTILGWIAVAQIRRFPKKLHGLGLAVFDGLLFPLLAYCGGVIFLGNVVADELAGNISRGPAMAWFTVAMVSAMAIACILPSVLIIRWVWRGVNRPMTGIAPEAGEGGGEHSSGEPGAGKRIAWVAVVLTLLFVAAPAGAVLYYLSLAGESNARNAQRPERPQHAHYGTNDHSAYVVHDGTRPHYILYYAGDFNSSTSATSNSVSVVWQDVVTIELKGNGRSFGLLRQSDSPERLILNGKRYNLREGHVFVLQDDGGVKQLALPVEMVSHDNLSAFGERVGAALSANDEALGAVHFGPVKERFLRPGRYLNLDTGDYVEYQRPSSVDAANSRQIDREMSRAGVQFYVSDLSGEFTDFTALGIRLGGNLDEDVWGRISPGELQALGEKLAQGGGGSPGQHLIRSGTWVFHTGWNIGILQIEKPTDAVGATVRFKLIQTGEGALASGQDDGAVSTFGPPIDRVLYPGLDLDSGKEFELPAEVEQKGEIEMLRWIHENGIDLIANADGERRRVLWTPVRLASMEEAAWKEADPAAVSAALQDGELNLKLEDKFGQGRFYDVTGEEVPITLAFDTTQGSVGLLQVTDFAAQRPGVRVRYKILESKPAESFGAGGLNPLPKRALAMLFTSSRESYARFNDSSDPDAIRQLAADQSVVEREMRSLLKGTIAEPLSEQFAEQKLALEKAHAAGDAEAMERAKKELKLIGERMEELFEEAGLLDGDRARLERSPDWGQRIVEGSADWRHAWKISGEIAALPPAEGLALMREHWSAIADPRSRERFLVAFVEAGHPHLVGVLELGLLDPSSQVKGAALRHLGAVALRDFSADVLAAEVFAMERRDRELTDVLAESAQWAAEALMSGDRQVDERIISAMRTTPHFERHPEIVEGSSLEESFAAILNGNDWRFAREVLKAAVALPLSEEWFRTVLLPKIGEEHPEEVWTMAAAFLQVRGGPWAVEPLVDALIRLRDEPVEDRMRLLAPLAGALGEIGSPEAIPALIGLVGADAAAVYPVGHHGLGKLTGVPYNYRHDGMWWRDWWTQNRSRFPEHVQNSEIPQFASPDPSPEMPPLVAGLFERLERRVLEVDQAAADGRILAMAPIFDEINEICDSLQGKNANPPPPVNEWGLPDVERQREVIQLLAGLEDQVERLRDAAREGPEPAAERAAALRRLWEEGFRPGYAELEKIWMRFERMIEVEPVVLEGTADVWTWLTPASFDRRKLERNPEIAITALPSAAVRVGTEGVMAIGAGEEPVKIRADFLAGELITYAVTGRFTKVDDQWVPGDEPTEATGQISWSAPMIFGLPAEAGRARALALTLRPVILWTDR